MDSFTQKIGKAVKAVAKCRGSEWWYSPHMAAASRAIAERVPLVDIVLEVRDARIPLSSEYMLLRKLQSSSKRIILLNKMDLANRSQTKEWISFFREQKFMAFGVNSHNKENIKEVNLQCKSNSSNPKRLLTFLQARVREMKRKDCPSNAITLALVGITNVGKSALANSLHQVGRISAAEKGKLKYSAVSTHPGETKSISSLKIASGPNIYILDTPGVLPPDLIEDTTCSKLALTGAIKDTVVGEIELAQYFLSILSLGDEYKKWANLCDIPSGVFTSEGTSNLSESRIKQYQSDHTQDFIVNNVRRMLFHTVSSFTGCIENGENLTRLVEEELKILVKAFNLPLESETTDYRIAAAKLLNLYRTGRLGHYTLDPLPSTGCKLSRI